MCTAIRFKSNGIYFGRTLDLEYSLGEGVVITARRHPLTFRHFERTDDHHAIIGIGIIRDGYPLYFDALNERGVWMAGLNFPHYATYNHGKCGMLNLASYELIPFVLSRCDSVKDAEKLLREANITSEEFSSELSPTPMHWMLCDFEKSIVIEQTKRGFAMYENPTNVMTNSPDFEMQTENLSKYLSLTTYPPAWRFSPEFAFESSSRGMGAFGLPGDVSSTSRFVRAAFTLANATKPEDEDACVSQFYHILGTVEQVSGTVRLDGGALEKTVYTSCADPRRLIYYYTTYENPTPCAVKMNKEDVRGSSIIFYPLERKLRIFEQN